MILSKIEILNGNKNGTIVLDGVHEDQIKDQSVDVSLGEYIMVNNEWINITKSYIPPINTFILAYTDEFIGTSAGSDILPSFKLKSSAARQGIFHTLARHGEVGYFNRWAMEFFCMKPIELQKGLLIGQIYFTVTKGAKNEDYSKSGTYQKHSNLSDVKKHWTKESIIPPNLKLKSI